jgi:hypothetical protein
VIEPPHHHAQALSEGRSVRWRAIWPFSSSGPCAIHARRRWQPRTVRRRHSAMAHHSPSLVRIGPLRIVLEQHRDLGTSSSSDEPSWSRSH